MPEVKIDFCNRAYADQWYEKMQRQNPYHFDVLRAVMDDIEGKGDGDISSFGQTRLVGEVRYVRE